MKKSINDELLKQLNMIWDAIDGDHNMFYLKYLVFLYLIYYTI